MRVKPLWQEGMGRVEMEVVVVGKTITRRTMHGLLYIQMMIQNEQVLWISKLKEQIQRMFFVVTRQKNRETDQPK
jgi:hypothetical protein